MHKLPVTHVLAEIKNKLEKHNRLILQAPPGAGKTTLVPLALLQEEWLIDKQIIMLEPRRLAARSSAARMAWLLGEKVGETIGYQIRQDKCISKKTRILVVTEGILTRKLQADPELEGIGLVIFDEFHERNINADLSLAFCLQSQELLSDTLKILIMSATLNTSALSSLLNTAACQAPVVTSQGKSFSVDIIYQADNSPSIDRWNMSEIISRTTMTALQQHEGNILIFLPGVREIKQLEKELLTLTKNINQTVIISPLYGDLSKQQQDQAICVPPAQQKKIVLATNIAETSLTIEGITIVIDSGLQRESYFNPGSGMNALHTIMIARDSAQQRSGRAGRLSAGVCYRLWSQSRHKRLHAHQKPEILRSDLAPIVLELAQWGIQDADELQWLDLPSPGAVAQAKELLLALQAIDHCGRITAHGKNMLNMGIHPRLAHMMLTAQTINLAQTSCLIVALLTEKDIFKDALNNSRNADIAYRVSILQQIKDNHFSSDHLLDKRQCKRVLQTAGEYSQRLKRSINKPSMSKKASEEKYSLNESKSDMVGVLLAFAYPDRIAKLRNNKELRYLLSNNKGAFFSYQDSLANEPFLVIPQLNASAKNETKKEARIFLAACITQLQLETYFPERIEEQTSIVWNKKLQKVECTNKTKLGSLTLSQQARHNIDSVLLQPVLLEGIKSLGLDCLPWTKQAIHLRQRIQFLQFQKTHNKNHRHLLTSIELPDFSDEFLLNNLSTWLGPYLVRQNSIKQLQTLDLYQILNADINWQTSQQLNELAPEKITVPSGSVIPVDYNDPDSPVLAVRLQELFGLLQTPAILKGSYPLLLHLLSPASRPMQLTHDLASFWENTYNDVKKELRGKYKKHYWPDDPLRAQATNRVKPRKS